MVKELHITVIGDAKTVRLHITDPAACKSAEGLGAGDATLFEDLTDFAEDVLEGNPDAGLVELNPANIAQVLGKEEAVNSAPDPAA